MDYQEIVRLRESNAQNISQSGGIEEAISSGTLSANFTATLSELIILGLLRQNVKVFFAVLGHGSTEIGEVLRVYQEAGLVKVFGLRSEIEASHAATAYCWVTGNHAAVLTSIGPGALQALAASLVPASNGLGVWYLMGDETSEDEGFNMQQIPKHEQHLFLKMTSIMGNAYKLHTPAALSTALRRGLNTVNHPFKAGPFYLLLLMNTQPFLMENFNLRELPVFLPPKLGAASGDYQKAAEWILSAKRIVVKAGGGAVGASNEVVRLIELADAVVVHTPIATGVVPYQHERCMGVGGSKGTLCGNYAMEEADLLVAVGTRAVCQSDSSRTAYPKVEKVININADLDDATHYQDTLSLVGEIASTIKKLNQVLENQTVNKPLTKSKWLFACQTKKKAWEAWKRQRYEHPTLPDKVCGGEILTQPGAIKTAIDWAKDKDVISFFDAGDVQANGFQIVEDEFPGRTFTDTGASYMGFAVSALMASAAMDRPPYFIAFTGDGSFTMNPQVLIDGVEYGARGCVLILDNNRMSAISSLQQDQYGKEFVTWNRETINFVRWGQSIPGVLSLYGGTSPAELTKALDQAYQHSTISLIHVPVYYGLDPLGGMGVFGRWNVGNWVEETQALRHQIGL
jgi:3D-(3,5/4)-trihydroxycyclohexane-1,2-dione acylhydrolase (decyclizing)